MPPTPTDIKGLDAKTAEAQAICNAAALPRTLMGGTGQMRGMGQEYLPKWPLEDDATYNARLDGTFLFNAYERAWQTLVGKVFSKDLVLNDASPRHEELWGNIDLTGQRGDVFCQEVFSDSLHPGGGHILVDFPQAPVEAPTLEDEQRLGVRPYWVYYPAESVLGWHSDRINGAEVVTMVRLLECTPEEKGWGVEEVTRIRALWLDDGGVWWARWRRNSAARREDDLWLIEDEPQPLWMSRTRSQQWQEIPLVTFYARRTGFMTFVPFLRDLAWSALEHWQSSSDQRASLHYDRVTWFHFAGFTDDEIARFKGIGPGMASQSERADSSVSIIERSGSGSSIGERDLERIKAEMTALSMEPLLPRTGTATATARALDEARADSALLSAVVNFEDVLNLAWEYTAMWLGEDRAAAPTVEVNKKFGLTLESTEQARLILDARNAGRISQQTFLERWRELGVLDEDFDLDEEAARQSDEAPPAPQPVAGRPSGAVLARLQQLAQTPPAEGEVQ